MEGCLSKDQIHSFLEDGVLVVDKVLTEEELDEALKGLKDTLASHGVDCDDLSKSGHALRHLSSTNGSGGVLDLFYDTWKLKVATKARLFRMTSQLWKAAYCHKDEALDDLKAEEQYKWHPFGAFDTERGYAYIDRIGYRLPSKLSDELGARQTDGATKSKKKTAPLQRSLTPHLDCCPENLFEGKSKWRPIQCFISLTDNLEANTGGFEVAKGFHREFDDWARNRPPSVITRKGGNGQSETISILAPCLGEYTHIRPKEDALVMRRIVHIPVRAGSAVFWDNRLPHANAYRHTGAFPRAVVYSSFLPDVPVNRQYVKKQLEKWKRGKNPTDQWIRPSDEENPSVSTEEKSRLLQEQLDSLPPLSRRLLGVDPW